jgi:Tfp pilus assembly protein PilW
MDTTILIELLVAGAVTSIVVMAAGKVQRDIARARRRARHHGARTAR